MWLNVVSPLRTGKNGLMDAPSIDSLRQEIDAIDTELHGLIRRRAEVVGQISATKPAGGLALRPGREAQVLRKRLATHDGQFPPGAVYRMWREMMSAFTLIQTPGLKIAICRPADQPGYWDLARDHFGCQIPFVAHDTPAQVLAAVQLAVLGLADKYNSTGAIVSQQWTGGTCEITLRDGGEFLAWVRHPPLSATCEGLSIPLTCDGVTGRLRCHLPPGGVRRLRLTW